MLICGSRVALAKVNWFAAFRGLAGALAGALLLFELLSTNGQFHQALHPAGKSGSNSCVVCLFAKGQVDAPPLAPVPSGVVWSRFESAPTTESTALVDSTYLVSPSRAPPAFSAHLPVLA